ncbi:nucleotidyl transferase AbiEii/AbiGii toxin family protein [Leifsonia sp. NPDC058194]|uniref:nucleotidyl transferase AbiEii/AbiGii toxin family protein n=1 Tax=Leifsonia sp. NPDC058194 TaxID=3346374 RepID=UPI0036DF1524
MNYYDRFLVRIFADSEWVLKGGTMMLARVPDSRSTRDIDLFRTGYTAAESLERLRELAAVDLDDHFTFTFVSSEAIAAGDNQPYLDGVRVTFETYIGAQSVGTVKVDLVGGVVLTGTLVPYVPAYRLELRNVVIRDYQLYPLPDQIADKVCATVDTYSGRPSSRVKDGIDLVVIARTQEGIKASELASALTHERGLRKLAAFDSFQLPIEWAGTYPRQAAQVAHCVDHRSLQAAQELMKQFIDPILDATATGVWRPAELVWR